MNDPTLYALEGTLVSKGYHVLRYNSRGVGKSSGWTSFSGIQEGKDLEEIVRWGLDAIPDVKTVLILGYSHGSLIASLFPPTVGQDIAIHHILLSYPLSPRPFLTAFRSGHYATSLNKLLHDPLSNVLVVYGDEDEFTGESSYDFWADTLTRETQGEGKGKLAVEKIEGATHFWLEGNEARARMLEVVRKWVL